MPRPRTRRTPTRPAPTRSGRAGGTSFLALLGAFAVASLLVYRPALDGPFLSDDVPYITMNPYVQALSGENLVAILDPNGPAVPLAANYSPVHLLLHALEWRVFGSDVRGWHVVNVLLHALGAALLVALLRSSQVPLPAAVFGGVFFLLHPANVEAVAWISQLKTTAAFCLALGALLAHPRRPALGALLFALALLAKPQAAFALPVLALLDWTRSGRLRWGWLAVWAAAFAALAAVEVGVFRKFGLESRPLDSDPGTWARTVVALVARYLVMAASSWGVSAFHELPRARGWLDPWWLAGLAALGALGWRSLAALRARREEAAWWAWAAVSFVPVSQLFPFDFAMADRYLYFILPGLLGGTLLLATQLWRRQVPEDVARRPALRGAVLVLAVAVAVGFAVRAGERAALWRSVALLSHDAERHYPDGRQAHLNAARRAARAGDRDAVALHLRAAVERGYDYLNALVGDPLFAGARAHPAVEAVYRDLASSWIQRVERLAAPNQAELNLLAVAHETRGEYAAAVRALERALAVGGFEDDLVRARLGQVRSRLARQGVGNAPE